MQRPGRNLLPLAACLAIGCAGPVKQAARPHGVSHGPQYGWLRKQGPVRQASEPAFSQRPSESAPEHGTPLATEPGLDLSAANLKPAASSIPTLQPPSADMPILATALPLADRDQPRLAWANDSTDYYEDADRRWNIKGLAAAPIGAGTLIAGIALHSIPIMLIGGAVALALGLIASRQCRDKGNRGKAFAMVGMILGAFAFFFGLMVLIWAA